jgi:8-oxo-dGTP pyrophosphatase MutT (NUDIX family)
LARAAAIIVKDHAIALIRRVRSDRVYFLFPGGQVEDTESPELTVKREIKEELGLEVIVGRKIAEVVFEGKSQLFFLAEITGGTFGTGIGEEFNNPPSSHGTYEPVWILVSELRKHNAVPREVVELVLKADDVGWPKESLVFQEGS